VLLLPVCGRLGKLSARTDYTTRLFTPQLTYRVPRAGWSNYEDTAGNFLLVPPGNDLSGVNAGSSDFVGVYTSVVPAQISEPDGCIIEPLSGDWTPAKMATWFERRPNLTTRRRVPTTLGGLHGVSIDLRIKSNAHMDTCRDQGRVLKLAGLFSGLSPSSLEHTVAPGMTMRMIMLSLQGGVLAVEIDDVDSAPVNVPALAAVARQLRFKP
jgi:hypothetical protein